MGYEQAVRLVVEQIVGHLDAPVSLQEMARLACLSPFHFHRVFTSLAGESPLQLQRRLRLERAAVQLHVTRREVVEIALDAGYETHGAFTRAFRAAFGVSPSQFRRHRRSTPFLRSVNGVHFNPGDEPARFVPRVLGGELMKVEIRKLPALRLACVRHIGPYQEIGHAFGCLASLMLETGLPMSQAVAIYYDDPCTVPAQELRSDAGMAIAEGVESPHPDLIIQTVPANEYAVATHVGPYSEIPDAWSRFVGDWLPNSGRRIVEAPCLEVYVNDCREVPKEELITELYQPVAPEG